MLLTRQGRNDVARVGRRTARPEESHSRQLCDALTATYVGKAIVGQKCIGIEARPALDKHCRVTLRLGAEWLLFHVAAMA
jgi:hypothetical protein